MVHFWCSLAGFGGGAEAPMDLVRMGVTPNVHLQENENLGFFFCVGLCHQKSGSPAVGNQVAVLTRAPIAGGEDNETLLTWKPHTCKVFPPLTSRTILLGSEVCYRK